MLNGLLVADISPFKGGTSSRAEYTKHSKILESMLSLDLSQISSREEAEKALTSSGLAENLTGFILKNLHRTSDKHFDWKINAPVLLRNLDRIMEPIDRQNAYNYQVTGFPVIFLKGNGSDYLPDEDFADIRKIFPAAEFIEIENAGHWIHADNPGEVIANMRKMLNG
jgi:pimeloyl-ACP methyl ester carboxylesterase